MHIFYMCDGDSHILIQLRAVIIDWKNDVHAATINIVPFHDVIQLIKWLL
jgi:hypothetical protein